MSALKRDWTAKKGVSNSSDEYIFLKGVVERIIRESAHSLISGNAGSVAGIIISNLAHKHGMKPSKR